MEALWQADWGTLRNELLAYATWRAGYYRWYRGGPPELAAGQTVEDVVQEVIIKSLSGVRRWDPDKGPLLPWLQDQVKSVIDALAHSAAHRREVQTPAGDGRAGSPRGESADLATSSLRGATGDPLEILLEKERQVELERRVSALRAAVAAEPALRELLEAILVGSATRPRHVAATLGVPVADIYNRLKRLRRLAARLMCPELA